MKRTILAFVVAPLVSAAAIVHDAGLVLALLYAYLLTYLFGIPVFLILKGRAKETHVQYMIYGAITAASVMVIVFIFNGARDLALIAVAGILAPIGATEGLCFSLIRGPERKMRKPNKLPDPTTPSVTPPAVAGGAPSVAADH